ncbi:acid phosphatase precursor [Talaromyces proteolyticus]|uniref:Acid phosphatase n=1 Tax=Talaromyces proteolyticus TaxID=1131652 RepID=A0AAD4KVH8_9EURO|nr:acid phosphatase precursor [Talaromyces proteolyticus]KAH8700741.1 acid phosphatase precursor [Talaromyces proteolyticus]
MHFFALTATLLLPLASQAIDIISSNDDGWAEVNIRSLYSALTAAGHSVVISAPAENESGTGSSTRTPTVLTEACEFDSCPVGSPAYGYNASQPRFNYVNSYPATSIQYGIQNLSTKFFDGVPDLAVTGPNVGNNLALTVLFSGTVGAAVSAVESGIPAIAFSGDTGSQTAWNVSPTPLYSQVYAELATTLTDHLIASGAPPYLPPDIWLNVNFPAVSNDSCNSADQFSFVLSRIYTAVPLISGADVETCGSTRLPTETAVVDTAGCYVAVSVGNTDKRDGNATQQAVVLDKLSDLLVCLP